MSGGIVAVVQRVLNGEHGPYAVTTAQGVEGSITFSLAEDVWEGGSDPDPGEMVLLSSLIRKKAGWRAGRARRYTLDDEVRMSSMGGMEMVTREVRRLVRRWKSSFFCSETERAWKEWVNFKDREFRDLKGLIEDPEIHAAFKARALLILLTPERRSIPFYWGGDRILGQYSGHTGFSGDLGVKHTFLTEDLYAFLAELVEIFYKHVLGRRDPEKNYSLLKGYNYLVVDLLQFLHDDVAERLFSLFSLNDPTSWWSMDEASGYNPLRYLLLSDAPEKWKWVAHERMCSIIEREASGQSVPRMEHEAALWRYADFVQSQLFGEGLKYSAKLFSQQIAAFVRYMPHDMEGRSHVIMPWHVPTILSLIQSAGEAEILVDFAVAMARLPESHRGVYNQDTCCGAEMLLDILKDGYPELSVVLQDSILEYQQRSSVRQKEEDVSKRREAEIMATMRVVRAENGSVTS